MLDTTPTVTALVALREHHRVTYARHLDAGTDGTPAGKASYAVLRLATLEIDRLLGLPRAGNGDTRVQYADRCPECEDVPCMSCAALR